MINALKRLINVEENLSAALLFLMTFLAVMQVLTRYVFKIPTPWIEELTRYLMVWMILITAAISVSQNSHLRVEILNLFLSENQQRILEIFLHTVTAMFMLIFTFRAFIFVKNQITIGQVSPAMQINMAWPLAALIVGGALVTLQAVFIVVQIAASQKQNDNDSNGVSK